MDGWINKMATLDLQNLNKIKEFVREELGCDCPPEVFDFIEISENYRIIEKLDESTQIILNFRINIGHRLLVYVLDAHSSGGNIINFINRVTTHGIKERDTRNFNRFRLVILANSNKIELIQGAINELFEEFQENHEKIHLHYFF
jgi:hypothetical protein